MPSRPPEPTLEWSGPIDHDRIRPTLARLLVKMARREIERERLGQVGPATHVCKSLRAVDRLGWDD